MSNTNTIEAVSEKFIVAGAEVIATMPLGDRMTDAEPGAKDLLGVYNENHVALYNVLRPAFAADPVLKTLASPQQGQERQARKIQIVAQMAERHLATRNASRK